VAQRDAYTKCRELIDTAIARVKPGATTADIVSLWPKAKSSASRTKSGLWAPVRSRHRPFDLGATIFSRMVSLEHPEVLEEEWSSPSKYWPAKTVGRRLASKRTRRHRHGLRSHHEVPAEELLVAGQRYFFAAVPSTVFETHSQISTPRPARRVVSRRASASTSL